jgi:hypothetical protein
MLQFARAWETLAQPRQAPALGPDASIDPLH